MKKKSIVGLSMFSGGGIAETYFEQIGIHIAVANELLPERAKFYRHTHPQTEMIQGDITQKEIFRQVMNRAKEEKIEFLLATPPCQGMSTLGHREFQTDKRNSLVSNVLKAIDILKPKYVMMENVPSFTEVIYDHLGFAVHPDDRNKRKTYKIDELLSARYGEEYFVDMRILNAMNYGVPQSRPRVILKMWKKNLRWDWPKENEHIITLREAIGDLPSLESGQSSKIKWHYALVHNPRQIEALRHTAEGQSALRNPVYYPRKADGSRVKGFHNTYNRMRWDEPAPARTTNNHLISGHNNVHPGRVLPDGTQSDARVLTFRELVIVSSLPLNWNLPARFEGSGFKESEVRQIIGEAVPPMLSKRIAEMIFEK